ncbi:hypothetical protein ACFFUT_08330 [Pseudohalocynthiibacter aestuariivivens]|uniref:Uncharacterized protein n=1 Tax=Pseudohalocynthiibacter aestuariivivens TaxID=1591409 RepID=A0ABV5JEC7_9RHOB|nr:hypothetical protein [Pseudohalocynthiibacter aestuariivivens]MBS9719036.1 hypothetical protein [Pseudohalocynthiibacter aestuariivivens]
MSLIHHNYVQGDFSDFYVQMVDLSCEPIVGPLGGVSPGKSRNPYILELKPDDLLSREELTEQADHVYGLLLDIAEEG